MVTPSSLSIFTHFANPMLAQAQLQEAEAFARQGSFPLGQVLSPGDYSLPEPSFEYAEPQFIPNQLYPGVYDARNLASLHGEIPPYQPSYPSSEQGYLVPVWVDDISEIPTAASYNWLDPSTDSSIWASYGVSPEKIAVLTSPDRAGRLA